MGENTPPAGGGRSPWPAVAAIGALLGGVAAIVGVILDRDQPPSAQASAPPSASPDPSAEPVRPVPDPSTPAPVPGGTVAAQGSAVVPVGDELDLDDDGLSDVAWDGFVATWIDSRFAAAPPGPTAERCSEALSGVSAGADWVSTVGAMTPPETDCIETSGGTVAVAEIAYDERSGGLAVTWTAWH